MLLPQDVDYTGVFESAVENLAEYFKWRETQKTIRETTPAVSETAKFSWLLLLVAVVAIVYIVKRG